MTFFYDLNKRLADIGAKQQINEDSQVNEKYMGFSKLEREIAKRDDVRDPGAVAASIGRKKYGKEKFQKAAAAGKKMGKVKEQGSHPGLFQQTADRLKSMVKGPSPQTKGPSPQTDTGAQLPPPVKEQDDIRSPRNPQALDYQQGPEDDEEYRRHHGLDDPDRKRERRLRATDHKTLDRLERQAVNRAKQIEEEPNEGNEFSGELAKAKASGAKEFRVDGKTYPVKEGEVEEGKNDPHPLDDPLTRFRKKHAPSVMKDPESRKELSKLDTEHSERKKTGYGRGEEEDEDAEDGKKKAKPAGEKRGRGRPKGTRRAIGAKGPTGRSKLLTRKEGVEEDYDRDEYDEEGEMAMSQARTIEDAAEELQSILDADENLPEWVQKKISLAKEYIDSSRDYLKANRPEGDEMMAEKAVSKAQRRAAGIAHAAKKGDIPRSELRGASKEMAKMAGGELKKFAKTKEKGLPAKKTEEVEETTTAGNVAPGGDAPAKGSKKGGMQFGKGIYDSMNRELEDMIAESMNVSVNMNSEGPNGPSKSVTVTATDEDADMLAALLTRSGLGGDMSNQDDGYGCAEQVDENEPDYPTDPVASDDAMQYAGGLNKPKSTGQTTTPIIANQDEREVAYDDDGDELRRIREMAGIQEEKKSKPDFPDIDKDGNRKETMSQAAKDKAAQEEDQVDESVERGLWSLWKRIQ